ncbi:MULTISPECIES: hypothetical protein [Thalassospira]|jgi:hypothetical protein|uniref:Uncharacterized protein n=2 Tax=Thalassospira TaxID=168934 RepID=A0AB72UFW1_9PROT|nr:MULTISPECIES: hypothetical protein [Thalassospira]AJD53206.1 hypothetical protein TH3_15510 [Thalassospira xiamenensis M-5 = DSM 17429]SIT26562.1 hypothetical protein SAMN02744133_111102 [Thalassospira xiamenensis M-5 = DSM 17429]
MDDQYSVQGAAALSICESLLLCLGDMGLMTDKDVIGILEDAASAHVTGEPGVEVDGHHQAVHDLIKAIIKGGNSVRHPA